ncbi:hypothetical protein [uncultured Neptuniibacter sp.]|uniref:hypothetical protein n=1 Tax=uncultured Neptuniibacter sp. TaxID=502143 RepID=UPI002602BB88|nr:hypothetical protein [uncultured Neptuniibacter sp.]
MFKLIAALLLLISTAANSVETTQPESEGKVILTVTGKILHGNYGNSARFNLEQLQSLKSQTLKLQTRWSDRIHEYHGPLLSAVLEHVGATGNTLRLTALNDYTIDIERAYIEKYQPILAWRDDNQIMSVRNKGPLWLILPLDKYPELNTEENTGKMIWQLTHIEIF